MHQPTSPTGANAATDKQVMSKMLKVEAKLFYLDLKENPRGRYLKITEKSYGQRSTIIVPEQGVAWFLEMFSFYAQGGDVAAKRAGGAGGPAVEELVVENKVFFFDMGENPRGRFLKVSERGGPSTRSLLIVPDGGPTNVGWAHFAQALAHINEVVEGGTASADGLDGARSSQGGGSSGGVSGDGAMGGNGGGSGQGNGGSNSLFSSAFGGMNGSGIAGGHGGFGGPGIHGMRMHGAHGFVPGGLGAGSVPMAGAVGGSGGGMHPVVLASQMLRCGQKRFFFDFGSNARGSYLRLTEVVGTGTGPGERSSLMVPSEVLGEFYATLGRFIHSTNAGPPTAAPRVAGHHSIQRHHFQLHAPPPHHSHLHHPPGMPSHSPPLPGGPLPAGMSRVPGAPVPPSPPPVPPVGHPMPPNTAEA